MHVWRSDVVGSLLRPAWLQEARGQVERGTLPAAEFKRIEDRAVDEAVALQEAAGLDVITDGEMRRYAFFGHLIEALEGFDKVGGWSITFRDDEGHEAPLRRPVVVGKLALAPADERRGVHLPAGPHDEADQGDAAQRAAGRGLLRSGASRRLPMRPATPTSPISWTSPAARSRSWPGSAASTSRSTRRSTRRSSTRPSARATASAAAIPIACSTPASSWTTRSSTGIPA